MEAEVALFMVMGLILGGLTLALTFGYLSTEKEREREAAESDRKAEMERLIAQMPRFFAAPESDTGPAESAIHDRLLVDLERFVKDEQVIVARFMKDLSVDSLYGQPNSMRN